MKALFTLLFLLNFWACTSRKQDNSLTDIDSFATALTESPKASYTILKETRPGNFKNLDILIDSTKTSPDEIIKAGQSCKAAECSGTPCNTISIWSSKRALYLWENRKDDPAWRKKNWTYMCEHDVGFYVVSVGELNLYDMMDSEYRRWGGKRERPKPSSFDLQ